MVKKIFAKSYIAICLLVMYAPIFVLMVFSFTDATNVGSWTTFSFNLYGTLFTDSETMIALGNTILIAVVSAIVATILGTLGAIGVFYSKRKVKNAIEMVGQIPVVNPEIVICWNCFSICTDGPGERRCHRTWRGVHPPSWPAPEEA